ncbi:hypothetical protein JRQ81_005436 [Phrynocephalus forsythii]|uniref:Uncharacterized protein n=1 Tax=Phrynocephalus forsythii TaxID=171643 RepID=A0A9Q0Y2U1_9SAUR|nr:hypothetical protein JRQ81_005436 [Phrynocephalus forsythii]
MSRPADGDPADGSEAAAGTGGAGGTPDAPQPVATQAHHQEEEEEACHLQEQVCVLREEVSHLQMENQQVKQKARDLEEENSRVLAENQWLKEQVQALKEQVENQQVKQKARDLEEENSHLSADITKANQQDRDHLSAENQRLKEQAQVLVEVMNHLLSENLCLKDLEEVSSHLPIEFPGEERQDHDQDMAPHLSAENQRLKERVHALVGVVSHQLAENKKLRQQCQDQEGAVCHPKREVQKVRRNQAASGPKEAAKKIIPSFSPVSLQTSLNKDFPVQFRVTGKTGGAEKKFLKDIKKLLSSQSVSLKAKEFTETSKDPLLIFCPIASRMGTDIQKALEGLHGDQKAILVVMHYVQKDNTETFLDTRQQGAHRAVLRTVHTRYTLKDGVYPCEMNGAAATAVASTIKGLAEDP